MFLFLNPNSEAMLLLLILITFHLDLVWIVYLLQVLFFILNLKARINRNRRRIVLITLNFLFVNMILMIIFDSFPFIVRILSIILIKFLVKLFRLFQRYLTVGSLEEASIFVIGFVDLLVCLYLQNRIIVCLWVNCSLKLVLLISIIVEI